MVSRRCFLGCILGNPSFQLLSRTASLFCICRVFVVVVLGLFVTWLAVDTRKRPEQLISFGGVCMFILLLFLLSAHRTAVSDRSRLCVWSCSGNSRFETRRDVIVACYRWLLLLRPGISFALVPLSSLELSLELAELLPGNNSELYGDCDSLINIIVFLLLCFFSGVMEECVLGSGVTVLYWHLCYSDTTWTHSF